MQLLGNFQGSRENPTNSKEDNQETHEVEVEGVHGDVESEETKGGEVEKQELKKSI